MEPYEIYISDSHANYWKITSILSLRACKVCLTPLRWKKDLKYFIVAIYNFTARCLKISESDPRFEIRLIQGQLNKSNINYWLINCGLIVQMWRRYFIEPNNKNAVSLLLQVKIWFQNRRMKWRNCKEKEVHNTRSPMDELMAQGLVQEEPYQNHTDAKAKRSPSASQKRLRDTQEAPPGSQSNSCWLFKPTVNL